MKAHDGPSAADVVIVDPLDETNALDRQGLEIRRLGCSDIREAGDPRADTSLVDVTAVVEFPSHQPYGQHAVDEWQIDLAIDVVIAAGVRGLRAFGGEVAAECVEIGRIWNEADGAAHGARAVQRTLRSAQYFNAIQIVQTNVGFEAAAVI